MVAHRRAKGERDVGPRRRAPARRARAQRAGEHPIGGCSVEIVGVHDGKRPRDMLASDQHRMRGSPRCLAPGRHRCPVGNTIEFLQRDHDFKPFRGAPNERGLHVADEGATGDDDEARETGAGSVECGIVHKRGALWTQRIELFGTAIAGAEASGEEHERERHDLTVREGVARSILAEADHLCPERKCLTPPTTNVPHSGQLLAVTSCEWAPLPAWGRHWADSALRHCHPATQFAGQLPAPS